MQQSKLNWLSKGSDSTLLEKREDAYLEVVVGAGGTFFSQGHDVVRSSVVKMEYFIL